MAQGRDSLWRETRAAVDPKILLRRTTFVTLIIARHFPVFHHPNEFCHLMSPFTIPAFIAP